MCSTMKKDSDQILHSKKELFVDYLEEKKHPKTDKIAATNIHKMRHMERFMGLHEMFECGFSKNGRKKLTELKRLRKKMAAHILLSPANVLKEKVGAEALKKGKVHEYCGYELCPYSKEELINWANHNPWEDELSMDSE
ncbi:hypothetical protein L1987_60015 [Smallanthus sonchifolius]|uniref:Uncharacterized protein n=1 Tax=Smallanthus sonchifolius TaxID=185202 RepID=A0ACB9D728_9ASTR|nr:hypothetical protein L1987_60015 [Smallanthus sonchifolius]